MIYSERIVKAVTEASSGYLNDNEKSPVNDNRATLVTAIFLHRRAMKLVYSQALQNIRRDLYIFTGTIMSGSLSISGKNVATSTGLLENW